MSRGTNGLHHQVVSNAYSMLYWWTFRGRTVGAPDNLRPWTQLKNLPNRFLLAIAADKGEDFADILPRIWSA